MIQIVTKVYLFNCALFNPKKMKKHVKKNECMINLGVTFRVLRLRKGYRSAEQFSYEHDLNRTAYWRWENGENITMKNFLRLCEIHSLSPTALFELVERRGGFFISTQSISLVSEPIHESRETASKSEVNASNQNQNQL